MLFLEVVSRRRLAGTEALVALLQLGDHLRRRQLIAVCFGQRTASLGDELGDERGAAHEARGRRRRKETTAIGHAHAAKSARWVPRSNLAHGQSSRVFVQRRTRRLRKTDREAPDTRRR